MCEIAEVEEERKVEEPESKVELPSTTTTVIEGKEEPLPVNSKPLVQLVPTAPLIVEEPVQ